MRDLAGRPRLDPGEARGARRHPVDHRAVGQHRRRGEIRLHIANVSATGFMTCGPCDLGRGERITVRLPAIGHIEAFLVWNSGRRSGFQFERVLRPDEIRGLLDALRHAPARRAGH